MRKSEGVATLLRVCPERTLEILHVSNRKDSHINLVIADKLFMGKGYSEAMWVPRDIN